MDKADLLEKLLSSLFEEPLFALLSLIGQQEKAQHVSYLDEALVEKRL